MKYSSIVICLFFYCSNFIFAGSSSRGKNDLLKRYKATTLSLQELMQSLKDRQIVFDDIASSFNSYRFKENLKISFQSGAYTWKPGLIEWTALAYLIAIHQQDSYFSDLMWQIIWDETNEINFNSEDTPGLLAVAALIGAHDVVKALIERKTDVNATSLWGQRPLTFAVAANDLKSYEYLLKSGADRDLVDKDSPLVCSAAKYSSLKILEAMQKENINFNTQDKHGKTPLIHAAEQQNAAFDFLLKQEGVDIDIGDKNGDTALYYAIRAGKKESATILITIGASLQHINTKKENLVQLALERGLEFSDVALLMIEKGAGVSGKAFFMSFDSEKIMQAALKHGFNPNFRFSDGVSILTCACFQKKPKAVSLLLKYGAEIASTTYSAELAPLKNTALSPQNIQNIEKILKLLLDAGGSFYAIEKSATKDANLIAPKIRGRLRNIVYERDYPVLQ